MSIKYHYTAETENKQTAHAYFGYIYIYIRARTLTENCESQYTNEVSTVAPVTS